MKPHTLLSLAFFLFVQMGGIMHPSSVLAFPMAGNYEVTGVASFSTVDWESSSLDQFYGTFTSDGHRITESDLWYGQFNWNRLVPVIYADPNYVETRTVFHPAPSNNWHELSLFWDTPRFNINWMDEEFPMLDAGGSLVLNQVPEPATILALAIGLIGVAGYHERRQRQGQIQM